MSYIAFDLDAFDAAESAARHAGASADAMMAGLLRLWRYCWRQRTDVVTPDQLRGVFGIDVGPALVAFGFVAQVGANYRVKGADRYLRIQEGRSKGGKAAAAKGNLKNVRPKKASATAQQSISLVSAEASADHQHGHQLDNRLSPTSEQRIKEEAAGPPSGFRQQTDALVADFSEVVGQKYLWGGKRDTDALKRLLSAATLEEVRARWRKGLEFGDKWPGVRTVGQLALRWNDLASPEAAQSESLAL